MPPLLAAWITICKPTKSQTMPVSAGWTLSEFGRSALVSVLWHSVLYFTRIADLTEPRFIAL